MSRWVNEFNTHPFQSEWNALNVELEQSSVDDQTVITSVQELARLKRVVAYIDTILSSIDPELAPKAVWALEIRDFAEKSAKHLADIEQDKGKAEGYLHELIEGDSTKPSIKSVITELVQQVEEQNDAISKYHLELLQGTDKEQSIQFQIEEAQTSITDINTKILNLLKAVSTKTNDLEKFHITIFGTTEEDGTVKLGLKQEIEARSTAIDELTNTQKQRYDALFNQIEDLLPGATSAGLASSYKKLKSSFNLPIVFSTLLFIVAIGLLVIGAMYMVTKELTFTPEFKLVLEDIPEWSVVLKAMFFKAPFIAPVVWLALFASTRRNQYARLKQEYAHKEALATSYESYKKQISDLGLASNELQQRLIESAIDAIAFNASTTLDKKQTDKSPLQEIMDKLSIEEVKKLLEFFKKNNLPTKTDDVGH